MIKGFRVNESVLKGDEHLAFNLTVLTELYRLGLLSSFSASFKVFTLYQQYLPFLASLNARKKKLTSVRLLFLTGSWLILIKCLFLKGEKVIIFHNFYGFLDTKSWKSLLKHFAYKILLKLGRIKPVVLNDHIQNFIHGRTNINHGVLQLIYNTDVIENIAPIEESGFRIGKAIFGNLFPGKVSHNYLEIVKPKHFGKLHGGLTYENSIDKYLNVKEYYNLMRMTDKVCVFNNNNHRVASGVLADAVMLGKIAICFKDSYLQRLILKYDLQSNAVNDGLEIDLSPLQKYLYEDFLRDLKRL